MDKLGGGGQGTVHRCWRPKHKGEDWLRVCSCPSSPRSATRKEFAVKKIALQKQFRLQRDADRDLGKTSDFLPIFQCSLDNGLNAAVWAN